MGIVDGHAQLRTIIRGLYLTFNALVIEVGELLYVSLLWHLSLLVKSHIVFYQLTLTTHEYRLVITKVKIFPYRLSNSGIHLLVVLCQRPIVIQQTLIVLLLVFLC